MASVEFITKRIEGKKKDIERLESKLYRIKMAESTNWQSNPYSYSEYDLKWTVEDLEAARKALAEYTEKLERETEKAQSRNVPAITEFLDGWKERVRSHYSNGIKDYYEAYKDFRVMQVVDPKKSEELWSALYTRVHGKWEYQTKTYYNRFFNKYESRREKVKLKDGDLEYIYEYVLNRSEEEALAVLEKELTEEYNRKYDFIIERTNRITGTITDASNLCVGANGELNGYIIGKKGTAKVRTIGAGGYNIQCFHFRTLISKMV